jgi:hypothetical protein
MSNQDQPTRIEGELLRANVPDAYGTMLTPEAVRQITEQLRAGNVTLAPEFRDMEVVEQPDGTRLIVRATLASVGVFPRARKKEATE